MSFNLYIQFKNKTLLDLFELGIILFVATLLTVNNKNKNRRKLLRLIRRLAKGLAPLTLLIRNRSVLFNSLKPSDISLLFA